VSDDSVMPETHLRNIILLMKLMRALVHADSEPGGFGQFMPYVTGLTADGQSRTDARNTGGSVAESERSGLRPTA
jgi:hypothetical protein